MYVDYKKKFPLHHMYHWTFMARRLLVAVTLIEYANEPSMQVYMFIVGAMAIFVWHLVLRPFEDNIINAIVLINEILLIGLGLICLNFIDPSFAESDATFWGIYLS